MAKRNIRTDGDPILRKRSREVTKIDDRVKILIEDMFETMDDADGVGLAAPQVGILKRIIVIDDGEENRLALINPEFIEESGEQIGPEGCLSVPGKQGTVKRFNKVKVKYLSENQEECQIEAEGFLARILQHETDHLNGILYIDMAEDIVDLPEKKEDGSEE
ncbi:peptide deformylase [Peptoniphilus koenoeneniae]|uniref:Peptide deformylase n=1 Tax=Peptoniphilus koenoeneniae TaxID=507751 RepID=A0ABU0ATK7_9FIRM|nr:MULTISPECIES: peptide deformylase [Peptoniphilus]ERT59452.1 peptide deformylase [Peptoniphilus sp. BV3C26]MDQ0274585.1 peptide deformylase [Peptoniphilus koenoeneniae]